MTCPGVGPPSPRRRDLAFSVMALTLVLCSGLACTTPGLAPGPPVEVVLPDYLMDLSGTKQDMILMRCDLEALWSEMEDLIATGDRLRTQ